MGGVTISEINLDRVKIVEMQCPNTLEDFYNSNSDFREYVEKYRKKHDLTVDEALQKRREKKMKLREIKPGMVVKCETDEELKILLEEAERFGYLWVGGKKPTEEINTGRTIHFYGESECAEYKHITWSDNKGNIDFSYLIIPELSAEEVLRICTEICTTAPNCDVCPMQGNCFKNDKCDHAKVIEICEQWKVDYEKKEPEIEWVFDCFQNSNIKNAPDPIVAETEELAKIYCETMARKHPGEAFAYIPVCRVKGE